MNNTTISQTAGWMSMSGQGRGTLQLLGSCLFTVFLCTWSAAHVNIPADDDNVCRIMLRKAKWMLVGIICPEYIALMAFTEMWDARFMKLEMRATYGAELREPFSMMQAYYAMMGGYAIRPKGDENLIRLDGFQYYTLLKNGEIEAPSAILPTEEIKDKSKGDWMTKTITCCQICWTVIQLIGRIAQKLPITTLEIFTLGLVFCAITTYVFWWNKPLNVYRPTVIKTTMNEERIRNILWHQIHFPRDNSAGIDLNAVRFRRWGVNPAGWPFIVTASWLVLTYKGIHLLAWNFYFPTSTEKYLWRAAAITSAVISLTNIYIHYSRPTNRWDQTLTWRNPFSIPMLVYVLCRVFVVSEVFWGLREVPLGAYRDIVWDLYIPHL